MLHSVLLAVIHTAHADFGAPVFTVDLSAPPLTRWTNATDGLFALHDRSWERTWGPILDYVTTVCPPIIFDLLEPLLSDLDALFPNSYGDEIRGIHASIARYATTAIDPKQRAVTLGEIVAMNLIYDITAGCTSIVASLPNGSIVHGRNLDYPLPGLANITADVHFVRGGAGGAPLFQGTTYLGYAGLLTGMRRTSTASAASGLSISINERDHDGIVQKLLALLENAGSALLGGQSVGFFIRDVLDGTQGGQKSGSWEEAIETLASTRLIAPMYFTVGGERGDEGAVITRDRDHEDRSNGTASGIWHINTSDTAGSNWFRALSIYNVFIIVSFSYFDFAFPQHASSLLTPPSALPLLKFFRDANAGLETNDDHWKPPEDKRRNAGNAHMENVGRAAMTLDAMFKDVLSQPPNLATSTTYTSIFSASLGVYRTIVREHPASPEE